MFEILEMVSCTFCSPCFKFAILWNSAHHSQKDKCDLSEVVAGQNAFMGCQSADALADVSEI